MYGTWNPFCSNEIDSHGIVATLGEKTTDVSKKGAYGDFPTLINLFSKLFKSGEHSSSSSEALEASDMVVSGEGRMKRNVM